MTKPLDLELHDGPAPIARGWQTFVIGADDHTFPKPVIVEVEAPGVLKYTDGMGFVHTTPALTKGTVIVKGGQQIAIKKIHGTNDVTTITSVSAVYT